jgi:hypothetical protein
MKRMSRFVIVYNGLSDPPPAEERSLVSALRKSVTVVDSMPGTILVDGAEAAVASVVGKRPNWQFSAAARASARPPHRAIKRAA